ncbi:unnamed protein product, partial [Rotaria sordida]
MPKSKSKSKLNKSMITSITAVIELSEELESSKCNCSTEKLQVLQQLNSQSSSSSVIPSKLKPRKSSRKLCYSNILSELFIINNNKINEQK